MPAYDLSPNSPRGRFDYVVRTYEHTDRAVVIFDVAAFAMSLFGLDRLKYDVLRLRSRYVIAVYGPSPYDVNEEGRPYPRAARGPQGSPRRPFDPAAASLAMAELKTLMDRELPKQHRFEALLPWAASKLAKLRKAASASREALREYNNAVDDLGHHGTAIGQWWEQTHPDLGRVSIDEALRQAEALESGEDVKRAEIVWRFDDGYTVQKLTRDSDLEQEGEAMRHCVGSYCEQVRAGDVQVYSLRDSGNRPHVTLEWDNEDGRWVQIKGKQNERPVEKCWPYLETFVSKYVPEGASEPDERGLGFFGGPSELEEAAKEMGLEILGYMSDEPVEPGQQLRYGDLSSRWADEAAERFILVPSTVGGDYSGDVSTEANYRAILKEYEDHPDVHGVYGGHGTYGIAINLRTADEDLVNLVGNMFNYPIYDESFESEFRMEKETEDWENWGEADFRSALEKELTSEQAEEVFDEVYDWLAEEGHLRWGFEQMRESANVYWEVDGPNMHVDLKEVVQRCEPAELLAGVVGQGSLMTHHSGDPRVIAKLRTALQQLLGSERPPSDKELKAIMAGLWMEGVQPDLVMPFDERQVQEQLRDARISQQSIEQLARPMSGDREKAYLALADAWIVYDKLWNALQRLHEEGAPIDDVILLTHEYIPLLDQVQPVIESLEPTT